MLDPPISVVAIANDHIASISEDLILYRYAIPDCNHSGISEDLNLFDSSYTLDYPPQPNDDQKQSFKGARQSLR